jgi:flagellum-specific ATP synthase
VLKSISRLRSDITTKQAQADGRALLRHMATFKRVEDMVNIGAYQKGANAEVDRAIAMVGPINRFLRQLVEENESLEGSFQAMHELVGEDAAPAAPQQPAPQAKSRQQLKKVPRKNGPPPANIKMKAR